MLLIVVPLLRHYNVLTVVPLLRHLDVATVRMAMLWGHSDFSEWPGAPCVRPLSQQLKGDNKTLLVREKSALSQILDCDSDLPQTILRFVTRPKPRDCHYDGSNRYVWHGTSPRHIQGHYRRRVVHIGVSLR